jgi:hypothetical protein
MNIDFYYALLVGWSLLAFFWLISMLFIFIRKPPKSRLTLKMAIKSLMIFLLGYLVINLFM